MFQLFPLVFCICFIAIAVQHAEPQSIHEPKQTKSTEGLHKIEETEYGARQKAFRSLLWLIAQTPKHTTLDTILLQYLKLLRFAG